MATGYHNGEVRKEVSGAHNKTDIRGHNYSLWTSFEFSSTILLRLELKGNSVLSVFICRPLHVSKIVLHV